MNTNQCNTNNEGMKKLPFKKRHTQSLSTQTSITLKDFSGGTKKSRRKSHKSKLRVTEVIPLFLIRPQEAYTEGEEVLESLKSMKLENLIAKIKASINNNNVVHTSSTKIEKIITNKSETIKNTFFKESNSITGNFSVENLSLLNRLQQCFPNWEV